MIATNSMRKNVLFRLFDNYRKISYLITVIASVLLLIITVVILKEMLFRNLGYPSDWTTEGVEILVLWVFLLPMAYTQMSNGMVKVTFVIDKFSDKKRSLFIIIATFLGFLFALAFTYAATLYFLNTSSGTYYPETGWPVIIQRAIPPLCGGLLALANLIFVLRQIAAFVSKDYNFFNEEEIN